MRSTATETFRRLSKNSPTRRRVLAGGIAASVAASIPVAAAITRSPGQVFLSGMKLGGSFGVAKLGEDGSILWSVLTDQRVHGVLRRPFSRDVVALARRPGRRGVVIDAVAGRITGTFETGPSRHLYGHGVFSPDGSYLFTTENDFEAGAGVIGVRSAGDGYRLAAEFSSYGIGPHELRWYVPGRTLAVANGGIRTHPETGRAKLNLAQMSPSLCYIDARSGGLNARHSLPPELHRLSIRHLAVSPNRDVVVAMQYEGDRAHRLPLVAIDRGMSGLTLLRAPLSVLAAMRHYCGSVVLDVSGAIAAVSCPRGNLVTFWSVPNGGLIDTIALPDGCGVASAGIARFLVTGGTGIVSLFDLEEGRQQYLTDSRDTYPQWDNHLSAGGDHLTES